MTTRDISSRLRAALAMHQQGQLDLAGSVYREILQMQPRHFDALQLLATIAVQQNKSATAIELFDLALSIKPDHAGSLNNRGNALRSLGRLVEALASYEAALRVKPDYVEALNNRGVALRELKRPDEALASYDRALRLKPEHAEVLYNRGELLLELGRPAEALVGFDDALRINARYAEALNSRGKAFDDMDRPEAALESFDRALAIRPEYADALNNRGIVLEDLQRMDEALACYEHALRIRPAYAEALGNRGNALQGAGRLTEAQQSYELALAIEPGNAMVRWNASLCRLLAGDFEAGWKEYEWRWQVEPQSSTRRPFRQPQWTGSESLGGKTILLHAEQGLGDTLQFCRYATQVAALGARVILEVQPSLKMLMQSLEGVASVLTQGEHLPDFDFHIPLLSLPLAFGANLSNITNQPYLRADPGKVAEWKSRLGGRRPIKIGLAWSGSGANENDRKRSIPLSQFHRILDEQADFICLQNELRPADREMLQSLSGLQYVGDSLLDFSDTAALVECVDRVIAADTSVAHLAGAMGKEVWLMLPCVPDWRWLMDRGDSPWYQSARLFRQPAPGDWDSVLAEVINAGSSGIYS